MDFASELVIEPIKEELAGEVVDEGDADNGVVRAVGELAGLAREGG